MAIPMLKIRRPTGRLIFNMGIPIPGKDGLYIETGSWGLTCPCKHAAVLQNRTRSGNRPNAGPVLAHCGTLTGIFESLDGCTGPIMAFSSIKLYIFKDALEIIRRFDRYDFLEIISNERIDV